MIQPSEIAFINEEERAIIHDAERRIDEELARSRGLAVVVVHESDSDRGRRVLAELARRYGDADWDVFETADWSHQGSAIRVGEAKDHTSVSGVTTPSQQLTITHPGFALRLDTA